MTATTGCMVCRVGRMTMLPVRSAGYRLRKGWICSEVCLRSHICEEMSFVATAEPSSFLPSRLSLGSALLRRRIITHAQLKQAVTAQCRNGGKLLPYLVTEAGVSELDIAATLAEQWSVPFADIGSETLVRAESYVVPLELLRRSEAMIVHVNEQKKTVHLAFSSRPDHALAFAIEVITGLRAVSCIARQSTVRHWLNRQTSLRETLLPRCEDAQQASSMLASYVAQHAGATFDMTTLGSTAWLRVVQRESFDVVCDIQPRVDSLAMPIPYRPERGNVQPMFPA